MKYFAYGSNMLTERLTARVPSAKHPQPYALHGFKLCFNKKSEDCSGKCNIVSGDPQVDVVHGVIFDIDDSEFNLLDKAEGVGKGYEKKEMTFQIGNTSEKVVVYVASADAIDDALIPYDWYYNLVLAGAEQHKLPSAYVANIMNTNRTQDPKCNRNFRLEALDVLKVYESSKAAGNPSGK